MRNLQAADVGKGTARCAAVLCGISLSGIITEKMCIQLLKPHKLKNQYTFKTGQAIATLEFRDIIRNWQ